MAHIRTSPITRADFARYTRPSDAASSLRANGGVVALTAINGPGAYGARFGTRQVGRPVKASLVRGPGGTAKLVFQPASGARASSSPSGALVRGRSRKLPAWATAKTAASSSRRGKRAARRSTSHSDEREFSKGTPSMKANRRSRSKSKRRGARSKKRALKKNKRALRANKKRGGGRRRSAKRSAKRGARRSSKRSSRRSSKRGSRRSAKRSGRKSGKRSGRKSNKRGRKASKRMRRNGSPRARDAKGRFTKAKRGGSGKGRRGGSRRNSKRTRGQITVSHRYSRGGKRVTKTKRFKYRAPKGRRGRITVFSPGRPTGSKKARRYDFTANRRGSSRRTSFRRNGAADSILSALRKGAPIFGGFAAHRIATGLIVTNLSSQLSFLPTEYQVPAVGLVVAALGAFAAKAAIKGEDGDLAAAGMFVSVLQQAAIAALRAAGQTEAASAVGGIATRGTTAYGAYELVDSTPLNGFGTSPYAQALAASPYAQALAATPFAGRGNYLDVPSLGAAFPVQAAAGVGAYPQQAAAGYGSYEITSEGVTLNGIGTDDRSMERELNMADQQGSVGMGFGADDVVGRDNITIPDGAESVVNATSHLPMVAGNFGGNVFGVSFGG